MHLDRVLGVALALAVAACTGPAGAPALSRGTIAGTVKDSNGSPVAGASVSTNPATTAVQTDASGAFTLASVPIGSYGLVASKAGYVDGQLVGVGVGAGASVQVSLVLAPVAPTVGALSGTIYGRQGTSGKSNALAGAQVCVEGSSSPVCTTSQGDGSFTLSGVFPRYAFVTASAAGFLAGETHQAVFVSPGVTATGVVITLSGRPTDTARYVGSDKCVSCHATTDADLVAAWQGSAHALAIDRTTAHVDVTKWPAPPASCRAPATQSTGVTAADPVSSLTVPVLLVRWGSCPGRPDFAMAFDSNNNGVVDKGETVIPVTGSAGGVANGAGQCGNTGILPAANPCSANYGAGVQATVGWWQQEYLVDIGPTTTPWLTAPGGTTPDALVLPAAWNQRAQAWIPAPDYTLIFSQACAGCHDTGLSLATDANGNVTSYSALSNSVGCERCHGPGSDHAVGGDGQLIVNPAYLTAQSQMETCGQCHSQGDASAQPSGAFGFPWNSQATVGNGNFIPGIHQLSDFVTLPSYGDPDFYWAGGMFPSTDHISYTDMLGSIHWNNPVEKVTCTDCHSSHGGAGGPYEFRRTNPQTGDQYVFQSNGAVLRNDVTCLACHATQGTFASIALEDAARYHVSTGGTVLKNGVTWNVTPDDQASSASLVASTVSSHMMVKAAMPAFYDPTGAVSAMPVGRCSSCHMAKTSFTGTFFSGLDASGRTANVIGDVTSHTFRVAWPDMSVATWSAATSWDGMMPNACGSCHQSYLFGK